MQVPVQKTPVPSAVPSAVTAFGGGGPREVKGRSGSFVLAARIGVRAPRGGARLRGMAGACPVRRPELDRSAATARVDFDGAPGDSRPARFGPEHGGIVSAGRVAGYSLGGYRSRVEGVRTMVTPGENRLSLHHGPPGELNRMTTPGAHATSATLLDRLTDPSDDEAWAIFYDFYAPFILSCCLDRGCSRTLAEEVLQEVMVNLLRVMPEFRYDRRDGHFRAYLRRLVENRLLDAYRREKRQGRLLGRYAEQGEIQAHHDEPVVAVDWDASWRKLVLRRAVERAKAKVHSTTFRSFEMYVLQERPIAEVTAELGISRNAVYQHKQRMMRLIQLAATAIEEEMGDEP